MKNTLLLAHAPCSPVCFPRRTIAFNLSLQTLKKPQAHTFLNLNTEVFVCGFRQNVHENYKFRKQSRLYKNHKVKTKSFPDFTNPNQNHMYGGFNAFPPMGYPAYPPPQAFGPIMAAHDTFHPYQNFQEPHDEFEFGNFGGDNLYMQYNLHYGEVPKAPKNTTPKKEGPFKSNLLEKRRFQQSPELNGQHWKDSNRSDGFDRRNRGHNRNGNRLYPVNQIQHSHKNSNGGRKFNLNNRPKHTQRWSDEKRRNRNRNNSSNFERPRPVGLGDLTRPEQPARSESKPNKSDKPIHFCFKCGRTHANDYHSRVRQLMQIEKTDSPAEKKNKKEPATAVAEVILPNDAKKKKRRRREINTHGFEVIEHAPEKATNLKPFVQAVTAFQTEKGGRDEFSQPQQPQINARLEVQPPTQKPVFDPLAAHIKAETTNDFYDPLKEFEEPNVEEVSLYGHDHQASPKIILEESAKEEQHEVSNSTIV